MATCVQLAPPSSEVQTVPVVGPEEVMPTFVPSADIAIAFQVRAPSSVFSVHVRPLSVELHTDPLFTVANIFVPSADIATALQNLLPYNAPVLPVHVAPLSVEVYSCPVLILSPIKAFVPSADIATDDHECEPGIAVVGVVSVTVVKVFGVSDVSPVGAV